MKNCTRVNGVPKHSTYTKQRKICKKYTYENNKILRNSLILNRPALNGHAFQND